MKKIYMVLGLTCLVLWGCGKNESFQAELKSQNPPLECRSDAIKEVLPVNLRLQVDSYREANYSGCTYDDLNSNFSLNIRWYKEENLESQFEGLKLVFKGTEMQDMNLGEKSFYYDSGAIGGLVALKGDILYEITLGYNEDRFDKNKREEAVFKIYKLFEKNSVKS